jgi:hypothetical protein
LHVTADKATQRAVQAEAAATQESQRAESTALRLQEHFGFTLKAVQDLSLLVLTKHYSPRDAPNAQKIEETIARQSLALFKNYLEALPEPEKWTYDDAFAVIRYVDIAVLLHDDGNHEPWLTKVASQLDRIEMENAQHPEKHLPRMYFTKTMAIKTEANENDLSGAHWSEKHVAQVQHAIRFDPKNSSNYLHASHALMNAALIYRRERQFADAVRVAEQSVTFYRQFMEVNPPSENDRAGFIDKLVYQSRMLQANNDLAIFPEIEKEAATHIDLIAADSPERPRIEAAKAALQEIRTAISSQPNN